MYNEEDELPYNPEYDDLEDDYSEEDETNSDDYEDDDLDEFEDEYDEDYDSIEGDENEFEDEIISCENCEWDWKLSEGGNDPFECHNCGHSNNHVYSDKNEEYYREMAKAQEFDFASDFDDDDLDEFVDDLDFSEFTAGEFKTNFSNANQKIRQKSRVTKTIPLSQRVLLNTEESKISNIKVPSDREVIVEGKERFSTLKSSPKNQIPQQRGVDKTFQSVKKRGVQQTTTRTQPVGDKVGINPSQFKIDSIKVPTDRKVIIEGKTPIRPVTPIQRRKVLKERPVVIPVRKKSQRPIERPKEQRPPESTRKVKPYVKPTQLLRPTVRPSKRPKIELPVERRAQIDRSKKKIARILVPSNRKVIVEGVNKFILSQNPQDDIIKNIGYYKGKKLKQLVLVFNNDTPNPFTVELFSPSAPLDYLFNTSQNLNNKIEVAGNQVPYSDVVYNLVANPTWVHNCKFTFNGADVELQKAIPLKVVDRQVTGDQYIQPLSLNTQIDNMQVFSNVIYFGITEMLSRPYIPDGMDVIQYTVLPFTQVTMAFYYEQVTQKDLYYEKSDSPQTTLTV